MSKPRISINKLGEYIQSNPNRRRKIVHDAKYPQNFIVTRYGDAREAIKNYFVSDFDPEILNKAIEDHESKDCNSDFQEQDKALSIESLENALELELPDYSSIVISPYTGDNPRLEVSGVEISVNPDLMITGKIRNMNIVGAIKFHISKSNQLDTEGSKNVATLLKEFLETYIVQNGEKVDLKYCISVDTFGKTIEQSPKSFKRRMQNISSACEEISLWWDKL